MNCNSVILHQAFLYAFTCMFSFFVSLSMQIYEFDINFCCKYPRQLTLIFKASCAHSLLSQVSFHCCNWKERMSEWKIRKFRTEGLRNIDHFSSHFYSFYTWYRHTAHQENSTAPVSSWQNSVVRLLFGCVQTACIPKNQFNILRFCFLCGEICTWLISSDDIRNTSGNSHHHRTDEAGKDLQRQIVWFNFPGQRRARTIFSESSWILNISNDVLSTSSIWMS